MSSYIMQDHLLHPLLTVQEAMKFSVNLKIGKEMTSDEKLKRVRHVCTISLIKPPDFYLIVDKRRVG